MSANKELFQTHLDYSRKLKKVSEQISFTFEIIKERNPLQMNTTELQHILKIMNSLNEINRFVVGEYVDALELTECMVVEGRV
jgi:hypothetical protein